MQPTSDASFLIRLPATGSPALGYCSYHAYAMNDHHVGADRRRSARQGKEGSDLER